MDGDEMPVVRLNRAAEVRGALEREIQSGRLPPGAPLDERALAARYGVSRTPVREAFAQLAAQKLVDIEPRQGVTVSRMTVPQLRAVLELLGELEALCAKFSARRMDATERKALAQSVEACTQAAEAGNSANYVRENVRFHKLVHLGSRNDCLIAEVGALHRRIQRYRVNDFETQRQMQASARNHERILQAILAEDEARAHAEMLAHVPAGTTGFAEFLSRLPPNFYEPPATEPKMNAAE
jgi:DNA-binding GntR family transcriptional regulator